MGWIGRKDQIRTYLQVVNADRGEDGAFIIEPADALCVGLDENEIVVSDDAYYLSNGHKCQLAAGLGSTSYGMQIRVF